MYANHAREGALEWLPMRVYPVTAASVLASRSMDAGMLTCPSCGASASPESPSCTFCNARLATATCARCFAMIFQGAQHCSRCGAVVVTSEVSSADARACPRCKLPLEATAVGDAYLDECARCGGMWLDVASFERIGANKEYQAVVAGLGVPQPHVAAPHIDAVRYIPCPTCARLMNRVNFAHCSGVVVDVCKTHGVWFDADELRQVVEFIVAGGLETARNRELEALADERRRISFPTVIQHTEHPEISMRQSVALQAGKGVLDWMLGS